MSNQEGKVYKQAVLDILDILNKESDELQGIASGYIEAAATRRHNGRKISRHVAKSLAVQFSERSDAIFVVAKHIEKELLGEDNRKG